jgi:hypothetical protein
MKIPSRSVLRQVLLPILAIATLLPAASRADIAIVIEEFADKVVVRYSGSLNTTSFTTIPDFWASEVDPTNSRIYIADVGNSPAGAFETVSGDPVTTNAGPFGTGASIATGVFSGDYFVITNFTLAYPNGYVSGSPLAGSLTFAGATLETLGINRNLAPGYFWGLSSGDQVTLDVLTGLEKAAILLQQTAAKKEALLKAMRKLDKGLSAAIRSGKIAKAAKLKKSIKKITSQIAQL